MWIASTIWKRIGIGALAITAVVAIVFVAAMLGRSSENQFVQPFKTQLNPIIKNLPKLTGELMGIKSYAECRAQALQGRRPRIIFRDIKRETGERLYGTLKSKQDELVSFLQSALNLRRTAEVEPELENHLKKVNAALSEFRELVDGAWPTNEPNECRAGEAEGVSSAIKLVDVIRKWLEHIDKLDSEAIDRACKELENCPLSKWKNL
jgi:hypothetical protein